MARDRTATERDQEAQALLDQARQMKDDSEILVAALDELPGVDRRALAVACANLRTGFLWLSAAVSKVRG